MSMNGVLHFLSNQSNMMLYINNNNLDGSPLIPALPVSPAGSSLSLEVFFHVYAFAPDVHPGPSR